MLLKALFHLVGAVHFFYGCYYDYVYVNIPYTPGKASPVTPYGGKFKYLTFLNAMLLTAYFTIAFLNDLFGSNEPSEPSPTQKPFLHRVKDVLFSSLIFPVAMFVGTSFWGIYAIDRELILPRSLDPYFPGWLNHVMHTNIVFFTLAELATSFRMYPRKKLGLSILVTFMLCYVVWVQVIYFNSGGWVYPVLAVLNWPLRIVFYVLNLATVCGLYSLGERLNGSIWSSEIEQTIRSGMKKEK